ncbi:MAG TPA: hypothetical protein VMA77_11540 [Solirubrobacteraceae bacterium]|nr:hypothetical protein [Solirubrobacteraceae bacterium]
MAIQPNTGRRNIAALSVVLVATVACAALLPRRASADADPASDVLLALPVFYPYEPAVATSLQRQLQAELTELMHQGLHLKVAIIGSRVDLGAIPVLFGKPQTYANFLEREISFTGPQPLLVVMPQGFGLSHAGPPGALAGLKTDAVQRSNGLTRSAIVAVARIARASGKAVSASAPASAGAPSPGTPSSAIGFAALGALAVLGASIAIVLRRRTRRLSESVLPPRHSSRRSRPGSSGKER